MSILYSKESIPQIEDIVVDRIVRLMLINDDFSYDFIIKFESGKKITLNGSYGKDNGQFNKIDLNKYKDKDMGNFYNIPFDVFSKKVVKL